MSMSIEKFNENKIVRGFLFLIFGIVLGVFAKWLDCSANLPVFFMMLSTTLDGLTIWLMFSIVIAVKSRDEKSAAVNVFLFLAGMVSAYYIYTKVVGGFYPRSYAMIWIGLTIVSPLLAIVVYRSKNEGILNTIISGVILGCLAWTCIYIGPGQFSVTGWIEIICLLVSIVVLRRNSLKENGIMAVTALLVLFLLEAVLPFSFV